MSDVIEHSSEIIREKTHLGIVIVGHVDSGKSTTTGHMIFKCGGISATELAKLKREANRLGKSSFHFAYYMDHQKEERRRGITITCTVKEFFTDQYQYAIIDAPGHRDFLSNMFRGASHADVVLLMVPANKGGFESSIALGEHKTAHHEGQTRQHARLCGMLGIKQMIVGVNKMDDPSVDYSQDRFEEIKGEISRMIKGCGFNPKQTAFIPMSGLQGDNLVEHSDKMPWYDGFNVKTRSGKKVHGYSLLDALNDAIEPPERKLDSPFRMPVAGVYSIKGIGEIVVGQIEEGTLVPGTIIKNATTGIEGRILSMQMHHKSVGKALAGDHIGLNIKDIPQGRMPKQGDILYNPSEGVEIGPVRSFKCVLYVQDHPTKIRPAKDEYRGFTPSVHVRTSKCACRLTAIHWKRGKTSTAGLKIEDPDFIEMNDNAEVTFTPKITFVCTTFDVCEGLGRIAIMDDKRLIAIGKVIEGDYK